MLNATRGAITDASIFEIAAQCPNMQYLNVSEMGGKITYASIRELYTTNCKVRVRRHGAPCEALLSTFEFSFHPHENQFGEQRLKPSQNLRFVSTNAKSKEMPQRILTSHVPLLLFQLSAVMLCLFHVAQAQFPSNTDREWRCPNVIPKAQIPSDYFPSNPNLNHVDLDMTTLSSLAPATKFLNNLAVIRVLRTAESNGMTPYFKYFGSGFPNEPCETWSCSKIFSAMNGAGRLRSSTEHVELLKGVGKGRGALRVSCPGGLNLATNGTYGRTPLGDLVTIIVTYDVTHPPYSSNALGGWFEMVGTRRRARNLVQQWMNRSSEDFGSNYGAAPPSDLQFTFRPLNASSSSNVSCSVVPDSPSPTGYSNTLSALTMAEFVKRIVFARELPTQTFPGTSWEDSKELLYGAGAVQSSLFPNRTWGGMSACDSDYFHAGVNISQMERLSKGMYRTFAKDGAGYSYIRYAGEVTFNGYACYPVVGRDVSNDTAGGAAVMSWAEYIVSGRVSIPNDTHVERAGTLMREAMAQVNQAMLSGALH